MNEYIYLLLSVFLVSKFHWLSAWSIFKLTGCLVQILLLKSFGAGYRPGVFAGLGFGHATKLLWLGDSLNTAKKLVPPGESLVGGFHRNNVLGPAGVSDGPGVVLKSRGGHWIQGSHC